MSSSPYVCGGPVDPRAPSYVTRPEEWEVRQHLASGCYVTIMGPRQIGKSTLLWAIQCGLSDDTQCRIAYLDLAQLGGLGQAEWYTQLAERIAQGFGLSDEWLASIPRPDNHLTFERFLAKTAEATKVEGRLYVLLDEVDSAPVEFSEMFFKTLRAIYHYSKIGNNRHFARYVFVFAGAFRPADLIRDPATSPFNISRQIYPGNFNKHATIKLVALIPRSSERWHELARDSIYDWTQGHPYLTQRLCSLLEHDGDVHETELANKVAELAESLIGSNDSNLDYVHKALNVIRADQAQLYEWLQRLSGSDQQVPAESYMTGTVSKLRLIGLVVRNAKGSCAVANRLYRALLDGHDRHIATPIQQPNETVSTDDVSEGAGASGCAGAQPSDASSQTGPRTTPTSENCGGAIPEKLGRYRLQSILGQGGFGTVYLAHDPEMDRPVAIKIANLKLLLSDQGRAAFLQEARSVARLRHPNIVTVYDFGQEADGRCFLVYEFIEGMNLANRMVQRRPSRSEATALVTQVAEALHCAHLQGLVHRDIKPGNILLDLKDRPYVADFGLALREQELSESRGCIAGTPPYMSPEQVSGAGHYVDARTDIYSLGVVFYELLCGRRPFLGNSADELFDQIKHREARPPRTIDDSIPRELEQICLKAISKRIVERYTTAKDFADELRHVTSIPFENAISRP